MILQSAKDYLASTKNIRVAHLVEIQLAGSPNTYSYGTDYLSNITVSGKTYQAGRIVSVGSVRQTQGLTNYTVSVTVPGEYQDELDKATTDQSYEGRFLNIYRVYLNPRGEVIPMEDSTGGPLIWFQGRITSIGLSDNLVSGAAKVTFSCAGLLADFEKVNGRITDDASHRGLVSSLSGLQPSAGAKRPEYQTDLGFQHANQTISTNIKYLALEKEYYLKKSWGGLKTKLREREVQVERQLDLKTSLEAKYLPVVYGVRRVQGIPVFLDVLRSNPSKMYCVYAVCEGEISSFLNVYVNGVSALCGPGGNTQESGLCVGNMAAGDTLGMYAVSTRQQERQSQLDISPFRVLSPEALIDFSSESVTGPFRSTQGTSHEQIINVLAAEGPIQMQFYHGKANQTPCLALTSQAAANNFLVQNSTRRPDGTPWGNTYWPAATSNTSGAALLDTAYVVAIFDISEDRTTLPELEFIVQGRQCKVYSSPTNFISSQTINPVWHLLDYLTNPTFGGSMSLSDIDLDSFIRVAEYLDTTDLSYQADFVKLWRYVGWSSSSGNRAIMQCNTLLYTEEAVTKLVESILEQFNGTLSVLQGKYVLSTENDYNTVADISIQDTIGSIRINTQANKDKWNSIQAAIQDPALGWGSNQISFFDSTFLAEDNGIRKQGRASFQHITNYYTARSWAQFLLNKSRFSKKVNITTYYKFFDLRPNDNVTFTHPRYGFQSPHNKFRVAEIESQADGLINLTLERYDSSVFLRSQQSATPAPGETGPSVLPPSNLVFTLLPNPSVVLNAPEGFRGGVLHWDSRSVDLLHWEVIIYRLPNGSSVSEQVGAVQVVPNSQQAQVGGVSKVAMLVELEPNSSYQLKVQAVNPYGTKSPFSIAIFTVGPLLPPATVPTVKNFKSPNTNAAGEFTGPNLLLEWDLVDALSVETLELQIFNAETNALIYSTALGVSATSFNFTLAINKASFASTVGGVGAFRFLRPRIRAGYGTTLSQWSELTNDGN